MTAETAEYPSVDASFLSALEWRFVGPYRGGRVVAVAGVPNDRWLRFILPLMVKVAIVGSLALIVAVLIGYH